MTYSQEHNVIARLKSNGAKFAIVRMYQSADGNGMVDIQGWTHSDTLTARDFAIRYEVIKVTT